MTDEIKFGDPDCCEFTLSEIEEILEYAEINQSGLDDAFGGDLYIAESVMRSMVKYMREKEII